MNFVFILRRLIQADNQIYHPLRLLKKKNLELFRKLPKVNFIYTTAADRICIFYGSIALPH